MLELMSNNRKTMFKKIYNRNLKAKTKIASKKNLLIPTNIMKLTKNIRCLMSNINSC